MPDVNVFDMPDEEFLAKAHEIDTDTAQEPQQPETPAVEVSEEVIEEAPTEVAEAPKTPETPPDGDPVAETLEGEEAGEQAPKTPAAEAPAINYEESYKQIIGQTFKAGGKEVVVNTPEEAIKLMQMGVGFHQKMNRIAPAMRIIETLREHNLLDENKINELVDISKKNPEAIAALVRSAGLEPHQLITEEDAPTYTPGQHVLQEDQVAFRTSVDNIREQGGEQFLVHVAQDWDVASRAEIYKDPRALDMLYDHKQSGLYDKISTEVERRRLFDPNMSGVPFIHAYLAVGNELFQGTPPPQQVAPTPVAVKPAVTPQPVTPNPAAARAAAVRSAPVAAKATPNYFDMPDEEFLKNHAT